MGLIASEAGCDFKNDSERAKEMIREVVLAGAMVDARDLCDYDRGARKIFRIVIKGDFG